MNGFLKRKAQIFVGWTYRMREIKRRRNILKKNRINLFWADRVLNLGDYLSVIIYEWICNYYHLDRNKSVSKRKQIMSTGSILSYSSIDSTVWGSGILNVKSIGVFLRISHGRKLDVRAVRGPITRQIVKGAGYECPKIYGDPAILMPLIYTGCPREIQYPISLIMHYAKPEGELPKSLHQIEIQTDNYEFFIDELLRSGKVISSSLHGIILAESYGIPAVYLNKDFGDELKFWDWYMSTNRPYVQYATTLEEAITMEPMQGIGAEYLKQMQMQLIEAFPVDLWE